MTGTQTTLLWIYAGIIAIWPIRLVVLTLILRWQEFLTPQSPRYEQPDPPQILAIIPAKDEETYLAECLASVARQTYPNLEILVVDDRSTDRTGEIARRFAAEDPRIRVLTIEHLPAGWTGKTHALHCAATTTGGEWLWFLDADTLHAPDALSIVMEYGRTHDAALVSLLPELRCETFWEQVVQPLAGITLMQSFPLQRVHSDRSRLAFANGQFILIRRTAYEAAGGHEAVRDRFVEDIGLAGRVKAGGFRIRVALIKGIVTCRMYATFGQLIRGWSRILYDALDRRASRLILRLLDVILLCQSGHMAFLAGLILMVSAGTRTFGAGLLALSVMHHVWMYFVFRLVYNTSVPSSRYVVWFPLGNLVIDRILLRAIGMCLTGKVNWRGTDYGAALMPARSAGPSTAPRVRVE
jgi:glycosyltransferase involved in cell wall biosynthesis